MFSRLVLIRREDESIDSSRQAVLASFEAALRQCLREDGRDATIQLAGFAGNLGLLQQSGFGAEDLVWFVPDELVTLANHAKWAEHVMRTPNRPALAAIIFEDTGEKARAFAQSYADRVYSTRSVDATSIRVAIRDAAANRARQALITGLADRTADTGSFMLPASTVSQYGADAEATLVVGRTATGAWDMSTLPEKGAQSAGGALQVPGYRIVSHLGSGGMADVFLAQRPTSKEIVVIKVVHRDRCPDPNAIRRFIQEFTLISRTRSPHIVQIYERGFLPDSAYIAMEHLPAGHLGERILRGMPPAQALEYARQIAHGLNDVHRLGVVHRDLKPSNILFRRNGTLAITDFGIAKVKSASSRLTFDDTVVGTPNYTSPETIRGGEVDQRADLYSLGVVLFEMLTRRKPYQADSLAALLDAHLHSPPPPLPGDLARYQHLVTQLLAKEPAERLSSAQELVEAIEQLRAAA